MKNEKVYKRNIFELTFESQLKYNNAYIEGDLSVVFHSPEGHKTRVKGFWDRGKSWKVRFAPPTEGMWKWQSESANSGDTGLNGNAGEFEVVTYAGNNPLLKHGFLKITDNGRGFAHEDGKPFFWLGDTVWSVSAKASLDEWKEFVDYRSKQGFNVVNINSLEQFDASKSAKNRLPFAKDGNQMYWDKLNYEYFQNLDNLMDITHKAGMITALVVLWCNYVPGTNPAWTIPRTEGLTHEMAEVYGRYLAARYAAYGTVWLISGDTDFECKQSIAIYDAAANAIKNTTPYPPLITAHLRGALATPEILNEKDWLTFHMFQSSHIKDSSEVALECSEADRAYTPARPVINGEPCYENIGYWREEGRITREAVRDTLWKSILGGANAGITYGAHGIWSWHSEGEIFAGEDDWQLPGGWREALLFKGAEDAQQMKKFFETLTWWELEPVSQELGICDYPECVASATRDKRVIVVYVQKGKQLKIKLPHINKYICSWVNPVSGEMKTVVPAENGNGISFDSAPWAGDAVVQLIFK
jgi:hypothetical protein